MIYLDNNSTTRVADEVVEAMRPYMTELYGNSHASHALGRASHDAIERSRSEVAALMGARPDEVIFTSCGTESNALVLRGLSDRTRRHIVTTSVEHPSVLKLLRELEAHGIIELSVIGVDPAGALDLEAFETAIGPRTLLVSVMHSQNETGVIHDVKQVARIAHDRGALVHVDAVQSAGKTAVDVNELGADFLSISGHKFHAPKGVGALYIRSGVELRPLWQGGGHEAGLRSGTQPTSLIVGVGTASRLAIGKLPLSGVAELRDRFERSLLTASCDVRFNGASQPRLPNTSSASFRNVMATDLVAALDEREIFVSPGAACNSGKSEPSAVIRAMNVPSDYAGGTVRFSLSRYTTADEVDRAAAAVTECVQQLSVATT
jgi:cysteine desulfurase